MRPAVERGRPREFDVDTALDQAMLVFREKGFHAASIVDLAQSMQLTAGSIYKAFGDKRRLFLCVAGRAGAEDARLKNLPIQETIISKYQEVLCLLLH